MSDTEQDRRNVTESLERMLDAEADTYRRPGAEPTAASAAAAATAPRRQVNRQALMSKLNSAAPFASDAPPEERLAYWDKKRLERQAQLRRETDAAAVVDCTFRPVITPYAEGPDFSTGDVVDRLQHRAKLAEQHRKALMAQAESIARSECTFNPEIHASPIHGAQREASQPSNDGGSESYLRDDVIMLEYVPVEVRTTQARVHHMLASDWHTRVDPECTFRPTISPVADEVYSVARTHEAHLSVFDRLFQRSRSKSGRHRSASPRRSGNDSDMEQHTEADALPGELQHELAALRRHFAAPGKGSDDMLTFYCNVLGTSNPQPIADALNLSDAGSSADGADAANDDDEVTDIRYVRFNDFITRQNELELRRRAAIERVRAETASSFQPPVCAHSRELVKQSRDRGGPQPARRKQLWDEPTFKPVISAASAKHRGRSTDDMLRDAARLEAHRQQLRSAKERAEAQLHPFRPHLEATAKQYPGIQSMLAVDNLAKLSERIRVKQEARRSKELAVRQSKLDREVADCTFAPKLNPVPSYISDMARSSHVLRDTLFI